MVLTAITALVSGLVALYIVAAIARIFGGDGAHTLLLQSVVNGTIALALFYTSTVSLPIAVAIGVMPLALRVIAMFWFYYIGKKVLAGDYGEESRWAAELVESQDDEFIEASTHLSQMELQEIGIVAANKEELRKIVIERAKEKQE